MISHLRQHDPAARVCFCHCPWGLAFYRVKGRGTALQIEFNEQVYRSGGRLIVEAISDTPSEEEMRVNAIRVGDLIERLSVPDAETLPITFGGSADALRFKGVEKDGEWVSIEFDQRVYRVITGNFVVEEMRNGNAVVEEFPISETIDPSEAEGGAFGAIRKKLEQERRSLPNE